MRIPVFLNLGTAQTQQWSVIILQTCDLYKQLCDSNIQDFDAYYTGLIIAAHTASKVFIHITRAGCNFTLISYFHNFANDHHPLLCSRASMSFLGKIFGGKGGQDKPVTTGEAIQKLRETEDMLMKKQVFLKSVLTKIHRWVQKKIPKEFLEKKIESEVATARKNAKTNKRAALQALKRKKRWGYIMRK